MNEENIVLENDNEKNMKVLTNACYHLLEDTEGVAIVDDMRFIVSRDGGTLRISVVSEEDEIYDSLEDGLKIWLHDSKEEAIKAAEESDEEFIGTIE